jgi:hypothetical protein
MIWYLIEYESAGFYSHILIPNIPGFFHQSGELCRKDIPHRDKVVSSNYLILGYIFYFVR